MRRLGAWWMLPLLAVISLAAADREVPLVEAVKKADTPAVRALLQERADVNLPEVDGTTALHWAAHKDDVETAAVLLRAGADVQAANRYGVTPLALACINGSAAMLETLLQAGADPNAARPEGETALLTAARTGNAAAVGVLLAHGADVHAKESWRGQDALMWAAAEGHVGAARVLLEHGARMNARSDAGYTPLLFAARAGHVETVQLLLAAGAGADVNETQEQGVGALIMAIHNAHFELATLLLEKGADPNLDASGYTPLHLALQVRNLDLDALPGPVPTGTLDSLGLIKTLLARSADPNARMTKRFVDLPAPVHLSLVGATPFLLAAKAADLEVMRLLLASGADPLARTKANATALMAAAGVGYAQGKSPGSETEALEALRLTLELGGDVNAADDFGFTALHGAAIRGANSIVRFLVERGARLDVANTKGQTPLALAAEGDGRVSTIKKQPHTAALLRELMAGVTPAKSGR